MEQQALLDAINSGNPVSAAHPLQVFDPKVFGSISGLILDGTVTAIPGANQFTIPTLAGLGVGKFMDATDPFWAFVFRKGDGSSGAPQGEQQKITAYNNATGTFTTNAFTVAVAAGDEILIVNPDLINAPVIADLDVPGADSANNVFERDVIGNKTDTATPDDMSALATSSLVRDIKRALVRMAPGAFSATIQGGARTDLATMLAQFATYFVATGAAWSLQTNNLAARTNIMQTVNDMNSVMGSDGANVFNPTIQGAAQTTLKAALAQIAIYFAAAGAAMSVTMNPGAGARTNLNLLLQDLADVLDSGTGITTFPAGAAAANGVCLAKVIRYIQETCLGYEGATALANKLTAARAGYLDSLNTGVLINSMTTAFHRLAGVTQNFTKQITSAANAGDVTVATVTTQPCMIKRLVLRSNGATTANLTTAAIYGGAGKVITFIDQSTGSLANINAADKQVSWITQGGAVSFAATKTIIITLTGTGAAAVDLQVDIEYYAIADGGYLA